MSDSGFFGMLILCAALVAGGIYFFKFQDCHFGAGTVRRSMRRNSGANSVTSKI